MRRTDGGRGGGISRWLRRAEGTEYHYAHLQSIGVASEVGDRLAAGQVIAHKGNSGDARDGATHLHLEIHPPSGEPVDPYPHLTAVAQDHVGG